VERTCLQRLLRQVPDIYDQNGKPDLSPPFTLVKDPHWPSFENFLYGSLDFQMVLLYILWWFLIENYTQNPVLALGIVYLIERLYKFIRAYAGEKNFVKKSYVD